MAELDDTAPAEVLAGLGTLHRRRKEPVNEVQRADRTVGLALGIALLRIVVGIVFVMHGQQKLFEMGVGGVGGFFASLGVPAPQLAAVVVSLLETVGGVALILGVPDPSLRTAAHRRHARRDAAGAPAQWVLRGDGGVELVLLLGQRLWPWR